MTALIPIYIHLFLDFPCPKRFGVFYAHHPQGHLLVSTSMAIATLFNTMCVSVLQDAQLSQLVLPLAVFTNHLFKTLIKHLTHKS